MPGPPTDVFAKLATYAAQYEHAGFRGRAFVDRRTRSTSWCSSRRTRCWVAGGASTEVREVVGAPDGRVASGLIFGRSPVDGRAVRALTMSGSPYERNEALAAAGYDDTAAGYFVRSAAG